ESNPVEAMLTGSSCGYPSLSAPGMIPNAEIDVVTAITAFKTIAREIVQALESILLIQHSRSSVKPPIARVIKGGRTG
ncbi:hypothetical protein ACC754_40915, partial [Rhizobium johnstonii]